MTAITEVVAPIEDAVSNAFDALQSRAAEDISAVQVARAAYAHTAASLAAAQAELATLERGDR